MASLAVDPARERRIRMVRLAVDLSRECRIRMVSLAVDPARDSGSRRKFGVEPERSSRFALTAAESRPMLKPS
jgi:hypothetical protein